MRILMLVNWKVERCLQAPPDKLAADYLAPGQPYWFFRYFPKPVQVDVVDIRTLPVIERLEKEKLRFYVTQFFKIWPRYKKYDLILSHGMQSGIVFSLYRRLLGKDKPPHVVFDIGSFNSAKESGRVVRFMQYASRALDGIFYHASGQLDFYRRCYPWLADKALYVPFGADIELFDRWEKETSSVLPEKKGGAKTAKEDGANKPAPYVLFVGAGYQERDTDTLLRAWEKTAASSLGVELRMVGAYAGKIEKEAIRLLPKMPMGELNSQIAGALFCILPLKERNFSYGQMTLLQQMAFGKAVITACVSGVKDYLEDEVTGLFYEPENALQLACRIDRLLQDGTLRDRLGRAARERVYGYYNEARMARDIEAGLERLGVMARKGRESRVWR